MPNGSENKPDLAHLEWAIDQRAKIQHTLLALYDFVRSNQPEQLPLEKRTLLDNLIAAAFSLWRAVFLAETNREWENIHKGQEDFLASVITNNAITYSDDKRNRAWTVGYYLENAKRSIAFSEPHCRLYEMSDEKLSLVSSSVRLKGFNEGTTRYEWESVHWALRIIFVEILNPNSKLRAEEPTIPPQAHG